MLKVNSYIPHVETNDMSTKLYFKLQHVDGKTDILCLELIKYIK
jgi:hypothetical protein